MKKIYIAAYRQSKFGKLMNMSVPDILRTAAVETCGAIGAEPSAMDTASVGALCNQTLNSQALLGGLLAEVPGLAGKPIEAVENACASGGQAVLSVAQKLLAGQGEVGFAVGFEKMRDAEGKMDGKRIGEVLGNCSHPDERHGKVFVFPHIFAEVMDAYMKTHGVAEEDLARIAVIEYGNARFNPTRRCRRSSSRSNRR